MAVRGQGSGGGRPSAGWWDAIGHVPALLAAGAVLLYAYLSLAYDRFYHGLGVDLSDVGLSYAGILARSAGFVTFSLLLLGLVGSYPLWARRQRHDLRRPSEERVLLVGAMVILLLLLLGPILAAERAAREVRSGKVVDAIEFPGRYVPDLPSFFPRFVVLAIHADPATIDPMGKPSNAPATVQLQGHKLLYLGQANSTVLLYDPAVQQAVYLPAGSVILHVSNCTTKRSPDAACKEFQQDKASHRQ